MICAAISMLAHSNVVINGRFLLGGSSSCSWSSSGRGIVDPGEFNFPNIGNFGCGSNELGFCQYIKVTLQKDIGDVRSQRHSAP